MAKPPIHPIKLENGQSMSYFEKLVRLANEYVKEDGIQLNFAGYTETLVEYANLKEIDAKKAWTLAKELNTWAEYFSSIANLIQKMYLDSETDTKSTKATASVLADDKKVANGDRLANRDPNVVKARQKRNLMKAFYEELEAKVKFLERGHYHCKATYELSMRQFPSADKSHVG